MAIKRLFEGMRKFEYQGATIRLWINGGEKFSNDLWKFYEDIQNDAENLTSTFATRYFINNRSCIDLANSLLEELKHLNAVEVTIDGNGDIVYRNWP